ncbi:MAG: lytic transglycosylase domain-containing protein [Ruminococcus sp.]|nr:lytic transglycosylase domain-containing protein [Ruminococcus sp.]
MAKPVKNVRNYQNSRNPRNNRNYKYARKEKSGIFKNFILWILVLAIFAGAIVFMLGHFNEETKNNLEKLNYPTDYSEYVEKAAANYDLEPSIIYSVIRTESNFNPDTQSSAGAYGIMQVMPSSFEWLQELRGENGKYEADALFDPEICIDYGCYLLKYFYDYYGNEQCAVAAYNAGFVVSDWLANPQYSSDGETLDDIPYPETNNYVAKVQSAKEMYEKLYFS